MLLPVSKDVWQVGQTLNFPGGVKLPANMTVLRDGHGKLTLVSPVRIDDALAAEIAALGEVTTIFAPNSFHHLFIKHARQHFPKAALIGAQAISGKRKDLTFDDIARDGTASWSSDLEIIAMRGVPRMDEFEVFHAPSKTLVVTDLFFNIEAPENLATKVALSITGTNGRFALSRMWRVLVKDKTEARAAAQKMTSLNPAHIAVAHGNAKKLEPGEMHRTFGWLAP